MNFAISAAIGAIETGLLVRCCIKISSLKRYLLSLIILGFHADLLSQNNIVVTLDPHVPPITVGDWYRPAVLSKWQWQLEGELNTAYDVAIYDVDLFDVPLAAIQQLHSSGKKVICYFSAGSYESFRVDQQQFLAVELGNSLVGWDDERWLDIRSTNVHTIMQERLELAKQKNCDGVEPDNMDGYANHSGFDLSASDQLAFNKFIANEAHRRNLSVALKNDLEQVRELVDYFDFAVSEQCFEYRECAALAPFIKRRKPVFNTEYLNRYVADPVARKVLCKESNSLKFSTLILPLALNDTYRYSCL